MRQALYGSGLNHGIIDAALERASLLAWPLFFAWPLAFRAWTRISNLSDPLGPMGRAPPWFKCKAGKTRLV